MSDSIKLSAPATGDFWEIPIVFEDDQLLAICKPSRLLVSPDRYDPDRPNIMKLLHHELARGAAWARERGLTYLANAHRLDFETSGILLLAKSKPTLVSLADQFGSDQVRKKYAAFVSGRPLDLSFEVDARIGPHPTKTGLMRIDPKLGKRSKTLFQVREQFIGITLLECSPLTGRTHQIRIHAKTAGFPIIGDTLYGGVPLLLSSLKKHYRLKPNRVERPLIDRVALHAETLEVTHPVSGARVSMEAPWPKDLTVALRYLREFAAS